MILYFKFLPDISASMPSRRKNHSYSVFEYLVVSAFLYQRIKVLLHRFLNQTICLPWYMIVF